MTQKYNVWCDFTFSEWIDVEASSPEEAEEIARNDMAIIHRGLYCEIIDVTEEDDNDMEEEDEPEETDEPEDPADDYYGGVR